MQYRQGSGTKPCDMKQNQRRLPLNSASPTVLSKMLLRIASAMIAAQAKRVAVVTTNALTYTAQQAMIIKSPIKADYAISICVHSS